MNRCRLDFGSIFSAWTESADEDAMSVDALYISVANFGMDDEGYPEDGMHFGLRSCDQLRCQRGDKMDHPFFFCEYPTRILAHPPTLRHRR